MSRNQLFVATTLAIAAGAHAAALPAHPERAVMFAATAVGQLLAAVVVFRGVGRSQRLVIAFGNAALTMLWLASRTVGVDGAPEPIGWLDAVAVVSQLVAVVGLVTWRLREPLVPAPRRVASSALALVLLAGASGAVGSQVAGDHGHASDTEPGQGHAHAEGDVVRHSHP